MRRLAGATALVAVVAVVVGAACVPASEPAPPAGALGFVTEPSKASQGVPFTTSDGWTVRIELLALQVNVSTTPSDTSNRRFYGSSETYRFDAKTSVEMFNRALPIGKASASLSLNGNYVGDYAYGNGRDYQEEQTTTLGLAPETIARFRRAADVAPASSSGGNYSRSGPSMLLVLRGERGARSIALDLTVDTSGGGGGGSRSADVLPDALVTVPLQIVAESLFRDGLGGALSFADFAAADMDRDGRVSADELMSATTSRVCGSTTPCTSTLADTLRGRVAGLFVAH